MNCYKQLACPICCEIRKNVHYVICFNGHTICNMCYDKLEDVKRCPSCRCGYNNPLTRNRYLEDQIAAIDMGYKKDVVQGDVKEKLLLLEKSREIEQLLVSLVEKNEEAEESKESLTARGQEVVALKKDLVERALQVDQLKKNLKAAGQEVAQMKRTLASKSQQIDQLKKNLREKNQDIQQSKKELTVKTGEVERLKKTLKARGQELEQLKKKLKISAHKVDEMQKKLKSSSMDGIQACEQSKEKKCKVHKLELEKSEGILKEKIEQADISAKTVRKMTKEIVDLKRKFAEKCCKVQELESALVAKILEAENFDDQMCRRFLESQWLTAILKGTSLELEELKKLLMEKDQEIENCKVIFVSAGLQAEMWRTKCHAKSKEFNDRIDKLERDLMREREDVDLLNNKVNQLESDKLQKTLDIELLEHSLRQKTEKTSSYRKLRKETLLRQFVAFGFSWCLLYLPKCQLLLKLLGWVMTKQSVSHWKR